MMLNKEDSAARPDEATCTQYEVKNRVSRKDAKGVARGEATEAAMQLPFSQK